MSLPPNYAALRARKPDAVIGNSILVFDLDRLGQRKPFHWPQARVEMSLPAASP
jgi:hypothetical protein